MSQFRGIPVLEAETKRRNTSADFFVRLVREKPLGVVGGVIVLILLFTGISQMSWLPMRGMRFTW